MFLLWYVIKTKITSENASYRDNLEIKGNQKQKGVKNPVSDISGNWGSVL